MNKKHKYIKIKYRLQGPLPDYHRRPYQKVVVYTEGHKSPDSATRPNPDEATANVPVPRTNTILDMPTKAYIYGSELDFMGRCILDRPNIETGGELFGFWTANGTAVVVYAIGPGPNANHEVAFFNQDVNYLQEVGSVLVSQFGLMHIGEWHSHHQLGLAQPSGHDAHTMQSSIDRKHLNRFLLCIGNCDGARFSVKPYIFVEGQTDYNKVGWELKGEVSPLRSLIDARLRELGFGIAGNTSRLSAPTGKSQLDINDTWFGDKGNRVQFKHMIDYLSSLPHVLDVKPQSDGAVVELLVQCTDRNETIRFPVDYPNSPLQVRWQFHDGSQQNFAIPPMRGHDSRNQVCNTFINQYHSILL